MKLAILFPLSSFRGIWMKNIPQRTSILRSICFQLWRILLLTPFLPSNINSIRNKESFAGSFSVMTSWLTKTSGPGFSRSTIILSWATRTMSSTLCCRTCSATCLKSPWAHSSLRVRRNSERSSLLELQSLRWYIPITRTSTCVVHITKTTCTQSRVWISCNHEKKKKR